MLGYVAENLNKVKQALSPRKEKERSDSVNSANSPNKDYPKDNKNFPVKMGANGKYDISYAEKQEQKFMKMNEPVCATQNKAEGI